VITKTSLQLQTTATNDLYYDYQEFLKQLTEEGIDECPPLAVFAVWRSEEMASHGEVDTPVSLFH
jgi:hypothetical protein